MNAKKSLSFYTNMPTPYQLDFFRSLSKKFHLRVVYFSAVEQDRLWRLPTISLEYEVVQLKDNCLSRIIQRKVVSFHFDLKIETVLENDTSDFVIVNGTYWSPNTILALLRSYKNGKKVFFFSEAIFKTSNFISYGVKWLLLSFVRKYTHGLLAIGTGALDSFRSYGYKKPMYIVPYNIDISCFDRRNLQQQKIAHFLHKYNPLEKILILTSGSLIERKGMDIVIKAFQKSANQKEAKLLIVGDGPARSSLEMLSRGNADIEFTGFIDTIDIPYIFSIADIFALASRYDGWALVINEAIAAKLPIICSNRVGAAADKLTDGLNAMLFNPEDVDTLSTNMSKLIGNKDERFRLAANIESIREVISSQYNAEIVYGIC